MKLTEAVRAFTTVCVWGGQLPASLVVSTPGDDGVAGRFLTCARHGVCGTCGCEHFAPPLDRPVWSVPRPLGRFHQLFLTVRSRAAIRMSS
jgi:hypothetical protein